MRIFIVVLIALNSHFLLAQTSVRYSLPDETIEKHNEPIQPIPKQIFLNTDIVDLGEKLFHDPLLSKGNKIACASCHQLQNGVMITSLYRLPIKTSQTSSILQQCSTAYSISVRLGEARLRI